MLENSITFEAGEIPRAILTLGDNGVITWTKPNDEEVVIEDHKMLCVGLVDWLVEATGSELVNKIEPELYAEYKKLTA